MLAFSNDYYGFIFRVTQSVELFCTYLVLKNRTFSIDSIENAAVASYTAEQVKLAHCVAVMFMEWNQKMLNYRRHTEFINQIM